jgi:cysteinyl-tRNA synthetase
VVSDLLCRYLIYKGYKVKHVLDIVDFTDKSITGSEKAAMELADYSQKYLQVFMEDARILNIRQDNIYVKASENVEAMLKIVEKLIDRNYAYEKLHSVYYNISKLADYGILSNIDSTKTRQGKSIDLDDYEKDSPADFALLKRSSLAELKRGIYYKTVWGNVRPSWHLECAAISFKYLGANYDIHVSGADETFPHCENILAINKAFSGHNGPNYWINAELVMVDGRKMSRSLNNALPLSQLIQNGYSSRDIRFFLMGVHYRKPVNYSEGALQTAKNTVKKIHTFICRLNAVNNDSKDDFAEIDQLIYNLKHDFTAALDDDLNIAGALAALFNFIGKVNSPLTKGVVNNSNAGKILAALENINQVLEIMDFEAQTVQGKINDLISKRDAARGARNWEEADSYREQLAELGIEVLDTSQGVIWRFK